MKRFAVAFFVMALFLSNLAAHAAGATFATRQGEIFQLFLNGQLLNGRGTSQVRLDRLPAGPHTVEFRIPGRRGVLTYCTKIFLDRGFVTNYILVPPGRHPQFMLKKVNIVRLVAPVCNTCPPVRPHGHGHPIYDDFDPHPHQPVAQHGPAYPTAPGNNYGHQNGNYGNNYGGGNGYQPNPAPAAPVQAYMNRYDVDQLMESIRQKSFESSKLDIARQALANNLILADDAKRMMGAFTFESTRLEFAKFVHPRVYDPQNFYRVYDAFEFESSISEMERWLGKK